MPERSTGSIQRMKDALDHREPDRVPLDIGGTRATSIHEEAYQVYRRGLGLPPSTPRVQVRYLRLPKVEEDFRALIGADLESVDPITAFEETDVVPCPGGHSYIDRWHNDYFMPDDGHYFDVRSWPLAHAQSPADLDRFPWPKEDSSAILANITPDASETWHDHRRAPVLGRTCPGIFEMLGILMGHEKAMIDLALNPALCEALMDKILELKLTFYRAAIDRILAAGVDYFMIGESEDLGSQRGLLISPDMYRRMVKPRHATLFSAIKKWSGGRAYIELHSCGAVRSLLPDFIESGVEVFNPVQVSAEGMDDTVALKRDFGDALVFHGGGVDTQHTLAVGSPQDVCDEVQRRIHDLAPGGGFIFTPVHSIQHDVPFENFNAMIETFHACAG